MGVEEVLEKSVIKLSRPVDLEEAEELLEHIAKNLPGTIHYVSSRHATLYRSRESEEIEKQKGSISINGSINSLKEPFAFDAFDCKPSAGDYTKIDTIRFNQVPGWDLEEYRPEVRQLWDDVRTLALEYFK